VSGYDAMLAGVLIGAGLLLAWAQRANRRLELQRRQRDWSYR
jgi:hypothetical protein